MARNEARLTVDNGSTRYGYGLFETMLVKDAAIRLGKYHWERLFDGVQRLQLELPAFVSAAYLEEQVIQTVRKNKLEQLCRVRLQVHAGNGGLFEPGIAKAGFFIECFPVEEDVTGFNENGLTLGIAEGVRKSADTLANLKTCNALVYAIAARQAKERKWNDALICNTAGNIIESSIANIFWVKDQEVFTPPLAEGCVAGVMRRHIIDQIKVTEQPLSIPELATADEVFLSNAIRGIKWVRNINAINLTNAITKNLSHLFSTR